MKHCENFVEKLKEKERDDLAQEIYAAKNKVHKLEISFDYKTCLIDLKYHRWLQGNTEEVNFAIDRQTVFNYSKNCELESVKQVATNLLQEIDQFELKDARKTYHDYLQSKLKGQNKGWFDYKNAFKIVFDAA